MTYGKSIELFLVNGSTDSLIIAELSNWNGKAVNLVLKLHLVIGMILRRQEFISCSAKRMTVLIRFILGKLRMLRKVSSTLKRLPIRKRKVLLDNSHYFHRKRFEQGSDSLFREQIC